MQGKKHVSFLKLNNRLKINQDLLKRSQSGFVLPMIVVTGLVLMIVMAFTLQTIMVSRENLTNQRIQLLTRQVAESGLARVQQCMREDKENVGWDGTKPIKSNTDCKGDDKTGLPMYVTENDSYRTSFAVRPINIQDDFRNMSSVGKLEIIKRTASGVKVLKTYKYTLSAHIKTDLTFEDVVFGSLYVGNGFNDLYSRDGQTSGFSRSVYFFTKTHSGRIASVGYNMDGVITGYKNNNIIPWSERYTSDPKIQYEIPYNLSNPQNPDGSTVPIKKIITDFQGNGWITFFIGYDGRSIYGTGSNINCDLGTGSCNGTATRPIWGTNESKMDLSNIPTDQKIVDIKFNASTYLLTNKGKIYFAGLSSLSPGTGEYITDQRINKPTKITGNGIEHKVVKKLYTDAYYSQRDGTMAVAVTDGGELYAWGKGGASRSLSLSHVPKIVWRHGQTVDLCESWSVRHDKEICSGFQYSITSSKIVDAVTDGGTIWALDDKGVVWSAGNNRYGQVGANHRADFVKNFKPLYFDGKKITKIAGDAYGALFLTEDGEVYGVGLNNRSQLGFSKHTESCNSVPCSKKPRIYKLPTGKIAKDIFIVSPGIYGETGAGYVTEANNYRNSFVVTTDGEVYGAGSNKHGQLGVGKGCVGDSDYDSVSTEYDAPQKMVLDYKNNDSGVVGDDTKVVKAKYVRSGIGTTIVITDLNYVFTVGNNANGQLGSGDTKECHIPKRHRYTNVFQTWYY